MSNKIAVPPALSFFNLPETWKETNDPCPAEQRLESVVPHRLMKQKKVQALQETQTAVPRFLTAALGYHAPSLSHPVFPTLYPTLPEHRVYSNAVRVPVTSLVNEEVDISQIAAGADAVELVLDGRNTQCRSTIASGTLSRFVAEVRHFHAVPVIYHVHLGDMKPTTGWKSYFDLLYQGLRSVPEYLTVDLDAPDTEIRMLALRSGRTKIIGHQDNTTARIDYWQSQEPLRQYKRAAVLGCDVVRLVKPCDITADNFSCMALVNNINTMPNCIPIIAYNTGDRGCLSILCNLILTPVHHTPKHQPQSDSNIHSLQTDMTISERWSTLFKLHVLDPLHFLVVGASVKHSLSPAMHNTAFQALGMPHIYGIHETNSLDNVRALFADPNFGGASVSLPFKPRISSLVRKLSPAAKLIGGSNTILPIRRLPDHNNPSDPRERSQRHRAGPVEMLYADNTDWMGICACMSRSISPANSVNPETAALVIGAGGMARAAVYCLMRLGVPNIAILNRTVSHAESLASHFEQVFGDFLNENNNYSPNNQVDELRIKVLNSTSTPWPENFDQPSIVICAIKAYDHRNPTTLPFKIPHSWMKSPTGGVVVEIAYHTPETPLMRQMREETHRGWTVVDPIEVFFEQACAQWELLTGSRAPRKAMWEACLDEYTSKMKNNDYGSMPL
ncbi:hypothetical protein BDV39DRAFT_202680 [Aspergillus sergii]|uniref:Quinate repressor protein n=1 Tax=Aspergillus sergii TaxID=1034303 RepID=A0A5N6X932_9EURO|nr:hypothetical protein BDV39DRAFT_202680 [Aspergillus sergii]